MIDVIVIGGGPAGSTAATLLAQKGHSVLLVEREKFPRFQIGESLLPYNNDLFERLGVAPKLAAGQFHPKYGAQFVTGDGGVAYTFRFDRNLPERYHSSYQVKRAEFDDLMLRNAAENGVTVREETPVASVSLEGDEKVSVRTASGETLEAKFVIDASGHTSVLGARVNQRADIKSLRKVAFFAHYRGVKRAQGKDAGNTVIVVLRQGWFWMIPVSPEVMSVGLVVDRDHVTGCGLSGEQLLEQTIASTPHVAELMQAAERTTQVYARKDFSFRMKDLVGPNFALAGDAAGFLDPIFSTGVFMAMKSADLVANAVDSKLRSRSMALLRKYERDMTKALGNYFRFIEHFYRREFLEVFLQPKPDFGLLKAIVGVLAGNIFDTKKDRLKLALFFFFVRMQKWRRNIAPPIDWDALPAPAHARGGDVASEGLVTAAANP